MRPWRAWGGGLRAWLLRETYALPLDVFRILVGLLAVAYFWRLILEVQDFSSPDGLLDHVLLYRVLWFTRLSLFHPGLGEGVFYGAFGLACLGAWGIVLGYRVKLCAAVLFAIAVSSYRWNFIVIYVDDAVMHLLLFWLLLLPVGHTLVVGEFVRQRRGCFQRWCQVTVPGMALRCFLGNVCLVYLVAGLWKLESPLWQQGFALYAILRLPIAYAPDFWGPQHLPLLQIGTYLSLIIEPLLPFLLTLRPGHPLKWLGLVAQLAFHLGIIVTLRVPFANLGLGASAVLFFREEIMQGLRRYPAKGMVLHQVRPVDRAGLLALALLLTLTLAMMRRLPVVGIVHKPAYALLWIAGIAQDYHLFNWIDRKNYAIEQQVIARRPGQAPQPLDPATVFPVSTRSALLQTYLTGNVRWMPFPRQHRQALRLSILERLAQRFCRSRQTEARISLWLVSRRIHPHNVALKQGSKRFLMTFQCSQGAATVCRTYLDRHRPAACHVPPGQTSQALTVH